MDIARELTTESGDECCENPIKKLVPFSTNLSSFFYFSSPLASQILHTYATGPHPKNTTIPNCSIHHISDSNILHMFGEEHWQHLL